METNQHTTTGPALLDSPRSQQAFGAAKNSVKIYGALSAAALLTVAAVAVSGHTGSGHTGSGRTGNGHTVNTFMWVRAALLPVVAVLLHRLTVSASRGSRRAFERVSTLAVVMPIAIVGVDLVPGVCPPWYAVLQAVCMAPVVRVAFLTRGAALRAVFPKSR
ncbi:hypothetical protein ACH4SP_00990 [Streptomyces sp. NPDC021093]|uniref:hypothetical protein n=1 Tax=Streptomyces sp. NPDC021093 TaxID=3365112 RepID=UPI0037A7DA8E